MYKNTLRELHGWFDRYTDGYLTGDAERLRNIRLKKDHTKEVCSIVLRIGRELGLSEQDIFIAETAALFHDIGRFEQYARYGTYRDAVSENHAELGLNVLSENKVLDGLSAEDREVVIEAVRHHNLRDLPAITNEKALFITRLLRDADKIDVLRVVIDFYAEEEKTKKVAARYGLPNTPEVSDGVFEAVMGGKMVESTSVRTWNDNKLLHFAWVYDMNFMPSMRMLKDSGYLAAVYATMPRLEKIDRAYREVMLYMEKKIREARPGSI